MMLRRRPRQMKLRRFQRARVDAQSASRRKKPGQLLSHEQRVGKVEQLDNFAPFRNQIRKIAKDLGEYAGIPMPLDKHSMIVEPRYRDANALMKAMDLREDNEPLEDGIVIRNSFWSNRLQSTVIIWNEPDGQLKWGAIPYNGRLTMLLNTMDCVHAWGIEQEGNAVHLLGSLVNHHQFKMYMLTGMFAERSKRSGLSYIFRRLRPTLVLDARPDSKKTYARCLGALCMHPIAYYEGTWAGAMCPTDDVIAHLMLMRGDEVMFWRRCNQHHPGSPQAGI